MTWTKDTVLWCDEDDCWRGFAVGGTVEKAMKIARQEGWVCPKSTEHYCPEHA